MILQIAILEPHQLIIAITERPASNKRTNKCHGKHHCSVVFLQEFFTIALRLGLEVSNLGLGGILSPFAFGKN
jgi:hypothetical protein